MCHFYNLMTNIWITTSSTNPEAVLNPFIAACEEGFIPDVMYHLESQDIVEEMSQVREIARSVVDMYGDKELQINKTAISKDPDFDRIHAHIKGAIDDLNEEGTVSVDITPGRKFMTAIAFATGLRNGVEHVYYLYVNPRRYGLLYPELPRTATTLYDFTEVL